MGSLVISDKTFSHVQEMASTESRTGTMTEGDCKTAKELRHHFCFSEHFHDPWVHRFDYTGVEGWTTTLPQLARSPPASEMWTPAAGLQLAQGLLFHEDIPHWSSCPANSLPNILITLSTSTKTGARKPFSTLLILSFTLETSTLVLRGTLVLVRRIRNSGTLHTADRSAVRRGS